MDFMAGYGSDEEEDDNCETVSPSLAAPLPVVSITTSSKPASEKPTAKSNSVPSDGGKKKKKLDISFLPQHIQDALLKGGQEDSDDDQKAPTSSTKKSANSRPVDQIDIVDESKPTKPLPVPVGYSDPLLQMLSAPKSSNETKGTANNSNNANVYNFAPSSVSSSQKKRDTMSDDDDEDDEDDIPHIKPAAVHRTTLPASSSSSSAATHKPLVTNIDWSQVNAPSSSYAPSSASYAAQPYMEETTSAAVKRKRERDIESQLLSGNLASLESIPVKDIEGYNNWDKGSYLEQQEREQEIMKMYTGDGTNKSLLQPNKVQNRRHQLSSLAMKAAETEISLLEASNQRSKAKAQTRNKYGW